MGLTVPLIIFNLTQSALLIGLFFLFEWRVLEKIIVSESHAWYHELVLGVDYTFEYGRFCVESVEPGALRTSRGRILSPVRVILVIRTVAIDSSTRRAIVCLRTVISGLC